MRNVGFRGLLYEIVEFANLNKRRYYIFSIVFLLGLFFGVYLNLIDANVVDILNEDDNILLELMRGSQSFGDVFFDKLSNVFVSFVIIFLFNLTIYTTFLNYFFFVYQGVMLGICVVSLVGTYFLSGIFSVVIILPINFAFVFTLISFAIACMDRAIKSKKYNLLFVRSFKYCNVFFKMLICVLLCIVICFVYSFVFGILLKNYMFMIY